MIRRIRRTPQFQRDIDSIYDYLYQFIPAAADRVFDAIEKTIRGLARFPNVGNQWISDHSGLENMRFTTVSRYRNYLIFFKAADNLVEVFRVVHAARDQRQTVEEIEP